MFYRILSFLFLIIPLALNGLIDVGLGQTEITPPRGTPSAGYADRQGRGMEGTHDPLTATALYINTGEKTVVLCAVDHLGFTYEMVQNIIRIVKASPHLANSEIYIASSHTHSGGGAYLDIPVIGEFLAGKYDSEITKYYEAQTAQAILLSAQNPRPAKIGIGYGPAPDLTDYRGGWPIDVSPSKEVAVIKIVAAEDQSPIALLFNYPVHPTLLKSENTLFSADLVGFTRNAIQDLVDSTVVPIFFNGAQGDIVPKIPREDNGFAACESFGKQLAISIVNIWNDIEPLNHLDLKTEKIAYSFQPLPSSSGLSLPYDSYLTEMNLLLFNRTHAFVTIPGELSCLYDHLLKKIGSSMGYRNVSIFGLTNDAHGYIISPSSWRHKTLESRLSFGGESYGDQILKQTVQLLQRHQPYQNLDEDYLKDISGEGVK